MQLSPARHAEGLSGTVAIFTGLALGVWSDGSGRRWLLQLKGGLGVLSAMLLPLGRRGLLRLTRRASVEGRSAFGGLCFFEAPQFFWDRSKFKS